MIAPTTASPTTPPTHRPALMTPEAAPAISGGTLRMASTVPEEKKAAMPSPPAASGRTRVSGVDSLLAMTARPASPSANSAMPVMTTYLPPIRSVSQPPSGDVTA